MTVHKVPTYYLEHRGYGQEVDTLFLETVTDPEKRFCCYYKQTPLDETKREAFGPTADAAVAEAKYQIETADWQTHYAGIITRINNLEKIADDLRAQLPQPASPSTAP